MGKRVNSILHIKNIRKLTINIRIKNEGEWKMRKVEVIDTVERERERAIF